LAATVAALVAAGVAHGAANPQIAGLQVALRAEGAYVGAVDGISGPATVAAVRRFQSRSGLVVDGRAGARTRAALGPLGRPLLGRRPLHAGLVGWDVSVLQFLLVQRGFRSALDGSFGASTAAAVRGFQTSRGLAADGIAGPATLAALGGGTALPLAPRQRSTTTYVVRPGDDLTHIASAHGTTLAALARLNRLDPSHVLLIGARLRIPAGSTPIAAARASAPTSSATATGGSYVVRAGDSLTAIARRYGTTMAALARLNRLDPRAFLLIGTNLKVPAASVSSRSMASHDDVRASIDRWAAVYGVDGSLARALGWMESGFQQGVVSSVGARGVMQLLPVTMDFVQSVLLRERVDTESADGNVRLGVRLLRHLLDEFGGNQRLALAAWYQGARAVREHGVYKESELFVADVLALRGRV